MVVCPHCAYSCALVPSSRLLYPDTLNTCTELYRGSTVRYCEYFPVWSLETLRKVGATSTAWQRLAYAPEGKLHVRCEMLGVM